MDSKKVPTGKIIPVYLTDEGDLLPIYFHSEEELNIIQQLVASILGDKIVVNCDDTLNDPAHKIGIQDLRKKN